MCWGRRAARTPWVWKPRQRSASFAVNVPGMLEHASHAATNCQIPSATKIRPFDLLEPFPTQTSRTATTLAHTP
jgi:hypothetical protein